jgi:hypothetical protein
MRSTIISILIFFAALAVTTPAQAAHHRGHGHHHRVAHRHQSHTQRYDTARDSQPGVAEQQQLFGVEPMPWFQPMQVETRGRTGYARQAGDPRPHAWCGWWLRQSLGVADRAYNLARNWAHWGRPSPPVPGAVVVWNHHVGKIAGVCSGNICPVTSGNDGGAVRTRNLSIAGAIAIRM